MNGEVYVCAPANFEWRSIHRCRRCRKPRRHVVLSWVWYGSHTTCCTCGAKVMEGYLRRRRNYDKKNAADARVLWPTLPGRDGLLAWLRSEFEARREV